MANILKTKEPVTIRFQELANGNKSIYFDIYYKGKRKREFPRLYLIPEKNKASKEANAATLKLANAIKAQKIVDIQNTAAGFTSSESSSKVKLSDYLELEAQRYAKRGSTAYAQSIRNSINHILKYKDINLSIIDKSYLKGYIEFLNTTISRFGRPLSSSAKTLYFDVVVIALNRAVKDELIPKNPAHSIQSEDRTKKINHTRCYLTIEELIKLSGLKTLGVSLRNPLDVEIFAHVRRAFLFSCNTGLRLSDVKSLTHDSIVSSQSGMKQIAITMKKTKEVVYVPLNTNALEILKECPQNGFFFKLPHVSTIEKHLKEWAKQAGVNKNISYHVSRHTFATLVLSKGGELYTISKLLGHSSIKTTQIYAKIVDKQKEDAVNLIPEI